MIRFAGGAARRAKEGASSMSDSPTISPVSGGGGVLTEAEIIEWWGPRCDAFEPCCCVCRAWARHDIMAAMLEEDQQTRLDIERDRVSSPPPSTLNEEGE